MSSTSPTENAARESTDADGGQNDGVSAQARRINRIFLIATGLLLLFTGIKNLFEKSRQKGMLTRTQLIQQIVQRNDPTEPWLQAGSLRLKDDPQSWLSYSPASRARGHTNFTLNNATLEAARRGADNGSFYQYLSDRVGTVLPAALLAEHLQQFSLFSPADGERSHMGPYYKLGRGVGGAAALSPSEALPAGLRGVWRQVVRPPYRPYRPYRQGRTAQGLLGYIDGMMALATATWLGTDSAVTHKDEAPRTMHSWPTEAAMGDSFLYLKEGSAAPYTLVETNNSALHGLSALNCTANTPEALSRGCRLLVPYLLNNRSTRGLRAAALTALREAVLVQLLGTISDRAFRSRDSSPIGALERLDVALWGPGIAADLEAGQNHLINAASPSGALTFAHYTGVFVSPDDGGASPNHPPGLENISHATATERYMDKLLQLLNKDNADDLFDKKGRFQYYHEMATLAAVAQRGWSNSSSSCLRNYTSRLACPNSNDSDLQWSPILPLSANRDYYGGDAVTGFTSSLMHLGHYQQPASPSPFWSALGSLLWPFSPLNEQPKYSWCILPLPLERSTGYGGSTSVGSKLLPELSRVPDGVWLLAGSPYAPNEDDGDGHDNNIWFEPSSLYDGVTPATISLHRDGEGIQARQKKGKQKKGKDQQADAGGGCNELDRVAYDGIRALPLLLAPAGTLPLLGAFYLNENGTPSDKRTTLLYNVSGRDGLVGQPSLMGLASAAAAALFMPCPAARAAAAPSLLPSPMLAGSRKTRKSWMNPKRNVLLNIIEKSRRVPLSVILDDFVHISLAEYKKRATVRFRNERKKLIALNEEIKKDKGVSLEKQKTNLAKKADIIAEMRDGRYGVGKKGRHPEVLFDAFFSKASSANVHQNPFKEACHWLGIMIDHKTLSAGSPKNGSGSPMARTMFPSLAAAVRGWLSRYPHGDEKVYTGILISTCGHMVEFVGRADAYSSYMASYSGFIIFHVVLPLLLLFAAFYLLKKHIANSQGLTLQVPMLGIVLHSILIYFLLSPAESTGIFMTEVPHPVRRLIWFAFFIAELFAYFVLVNVVMVRTTFAARMLGEPPSIRSIVYKTILCIALEFVAGLVFFIEGFSTNPLLALVLAMTLWLPQLFHEEDVRGLPVAYIGLVPAAVALALHGSFVYPSRHAEGIAEAQGLANYEEAAAILAAGGAPANNNSALRDPVLGALNTLILVGASSPLLPSRPFAYRIVVLSLLLLAALSFIMCFKRYVVLARINPLYRRFAYSYDFSLRRDMAKLAEAIAEDACCSICAAPLLPSTDGADNNDNNTNERKSSNNTDEGESGISNRVEAGGNNGEALTMSQTDQDGLWVTPCHHFYHRACLELWMAEKMICPLCRRVLPQP